MIMEVGHLVRDFEIVTAIDQTDTILREIDMNTMVTGC